MVDRSVAWVSQVERGVRKVDRMSVLEAVAAGLEVPLRMGEPGSAIRPEPRRSRRWPHHSTLATVTVSGTWNVTAPADLSPAICGNEQPPADLACRRAIVHGGARGRRARSWRESARRAPG